MTHQSDKQAWLLARREAFGASEVARLLCESPAKNEAERSAQRGLLIAEKAGLSEGFAGNESTELGEALELPILEIAARKFGLRIVPSGIWTRHRKIERLGATPDAFVETPYGRIPLNAKITSSQAMEDCRPVKKNGEPSAAAFATGLPLYFRIQAICEAMVCEASHAAMLVLHASGGLKLRLYVQPRHEALEARIEREILSAWADVVRLKNGEAA